jgi:hypothetical protein
VRTFLTLAVAIVCLPQSSFAASACSHGSLSNYIGLGTDGCTIGSNTLFDFATLSGTSAATPISPNDVSISPFGSGASPGLAITVSVSASSERVLEALFTYRMAGNSYVGSTISLAGSSESGDGAVTGIQNFCANGTFGPDGVSGCSGTPGSLLTLDGIQNTDATSYNRASMLSVTDDLTIDGGLTGSASAGTLSNQFNTVPEPRAALLTGVGVLIAVVIRRKLAKRICP